MCGIMPPVEQQREEQEVDDSEVHCQGSHPI